MMHKIIIALLGIALLCSCSRKDDIPEPPTPSAIGERTVIIYMSGENNLTNSSYNYLSRDLEEIEKGSTSLSSNQHLIVFIDSVGKNAMPHIVEYAKGKRKVVYEYDSDFYASDASKFREIIEWSMNHYPAAEYGLVLWGHASGWAVETDTIATRAATRAYGYDEGYDTGGSCKSMNITQMAKALEGLPKFKYILADCCNFICVESAYELRDAADYLIGSPAEIPSDGAAYDKMMPMLFSHSDSYYRDIADAYYNYYLEAYKTPLYTEDPEIDFGYVYGYSVPMAVIDLHQMEQLGLATEAALSSFIPMAPSDLNLSDLAFYFGSGSSTAMYDMKSIFRKYASDAVYQAWLTAFDQAVPYHRFSRAWQTEYTTIYNNFSWLKEDQEADTRYGCVSMYFPQQKYAYSSYKYNSRIKNYQWYYRMNWAKYGW